MDACYDSLRFSLSDENGDLRFESFDISNMPECHDFAVRLREYLLSRPLKDLDPGWVRRMQCPGAGECTSTMARVVEDFQQLFLRRNAGTGLGENEWLNSRNHSVA